MTNLDPLPFLYEYPNGTEQRMQHAPLVSRVGWLFSPRPGFEQDVEKYDAETRKYA